MSAYHYGEFKAGKTTIVFAKDEDLVLGWLTTNTFDTTDDGPLTETRYALHKDGRMKKTNPERYGVSYFSKRGLVWHDVENIPDNAEFIGNYKNDMF